MLPVPMPTNAWEIFWLAFRVVTTLAFILVTIWGLSIVRQMLNQIQNDRLERDKNLAELKKTAEELAKKTAQIVEEAKARDLRLSTQLEENTELTRTAVSTTKDTNEKVGRTGDRIERAITEKSTIATLEHIDKNTAETAENTKKK